MDHFDFLFVVNPIAGGVSKAPFYDLLKSDRNSQSIAYQIYKTTGNNDEDALLEILSANSFECVVAVGGDGTLHLLATLLHGQDYKIGVIPFGSANGMATDLKISPELSEAWQVLLRRNTRKIDMVKINEQFYSLHLSDVGLNARIVKRFEERKMRGRLGYLVQFLRELPQSKMLKYNLYADNNHFRGRAYMVVIANSREYGTGAIVNPEGEVDDGRFEVCLVKSISLRAMFAALVSIFKKDIKYRTLLVHSCHNARILFRKKQTLQIDGEVIGDFDEVVAQILPGCLNMIV